MRKRRKAYASPCESAKLFKFYSLQLPFASYRRNSFAVMRSENLFFSLLTRNFWKTGQFKNDDTIKIYCALSRLSLENVKYFSFFFIFILLLLLLLFFIYSFCACTTKRNSSFTQFKVFIQSTSFLDVQFQLIKLCTLHREENLIKFHSCKS